MKTCKGCGSFFNKKCDYCGYEDSNWDEKDRLDIVTLTIKGDMNKIKINYGKSQKDNVVVNGDMGKFDLCAKILNIVINGDMNKITLDEKINYTVNQKGDMNRIKIKGMVMGICL